jgi:hypothetical protein
VLLPMPLLLLPHTFKLFMPVGHKPALQSPLEGVIALLGVCGCTPAPAAAAPLCACVLSTPVCLTILLQLSGGCGNNDRKAAAA